MTDHAETLSVVAEEVHYRQVIAPNHQSGSFTADDADNHDFRVSARGKSAMNFHIDNPANVALSWSFYGLHEKDGEIGDAGTFLLDTGAVAAADKGDEGFVNYVYPWYLLRLAYGSSPTDTPKKTTTVYFDLAGR